MVKRRLKQAADKVSKLPLPNLRGTEDKVREALKSVPKITDETVTEHREAVLGSARKFIYPLKHSRHHIVRISISLLIGVVIAFFIYCGLELYDFQSTSGFMYSVTEVIPFPVAKAGPSWISYSSYLFELRRNIHYYQTQQQANFSSPSGKNQLLSLKQQAMAQVIENAYVKQLAKANHVSVSDSEVNNEVTIVRSQNRLGSSNQVFDSVLKDFWGWTENDFKQELKQQLLQQKVVAKLDTPINQKAETVYVQLQQGADFATEASQFSDDTSTRGSGGQYSSPITPDTQTLPPQIVNEAFRLKAGQISPIINTDYSLEILKAITVSPVSIQAAHIQFTFEPITTYTNPLQSKYPPNKYIKL